MELMETRNYELNFDNKELAKASKLIVKLSEGIIKNQLEIAHVIATVDETKCYEEDGFKNVHEWTNRAFGFKKTASYSLLKIGREYVKTCMNNKNKVIGYSSNLVEDPDNDFNTSQIEKMLPLGHEKAKEFVDSELITPDMTCKEIEKVVKAYRDELKKTDEPEDVQDEPEDVQDEPEDVQDEPEDELTIAEIDLVLDNLGNKIFRLNGNNVSKEQLIEAIKNFDEEFFD